MQSLGYTPASDHGGALGMVSITVLRVGQASPERAHAMLGYLRAVALA